MTGSELAKVCQQSHMSVMGRNTVFSCLLGLKIPGSACSQLAGGLGTHMGSIGKQVPLPLHHHYVTGAGARTLCSSLDP